MANKDGFSTTLDDLDQGVGQTSRMTAAFEAELDRLRQSMTVTAREVGTAAAFLASPLASGITGHVLYVDKGYNAMGAPIDL